MLILCWPTTLALLPTDAAQWGLKQLELLTKESTLRIAGDVLLTIIVIGIPPILSDRLHLTRRTSTTGTMTLTIRSSWLWTSRPHLPSINEETWWKVLTTIFFPLGRPL